MGISTLPAAHRRTFSGIAWSRRVRLATEYSRPGSGMVSN
jgi:hypothetical protein